MRVLRHLAEPLGIAMSPGGWVFVKELQVKLACLQEIADRDLEWLIATDTEAKMDMAYQPSSVPSWKDSPRVGTGRPGMRLTSGGLPLAIRARQGRSLPGIDPSQTFRELVTPESYHRRMGKPITGQLVWHCTYPGGCPCILRIGVYPGGLGGTRRAIYWSPIEPDVDDIAYLPGMR